MTGATTATSARPVENGSASGWTTGELARRLGAELVGRGDVSVTRLDALDRADGGTLTFIRDARHAAEWPRSKAAAAIVTRDVALPADDGRPVLLVADADLALIRILEALTPEPHRPRGVHEGSSIDASAEVDDTASVGAGAVIGPGSVVGARTVIHGCVVIGAGVTIGADCEVRAGAVIEDRCVLGDRVRIHPNAVIGSDGFGYRPSPDGRGHIKIPHAGNVEIGDDVEIGASTTIDRGKFGATVIGSGAKLDNLVQIGHNCRIGRSCIVCGCCAMAGSVTIGDGVVLAGGVGIADNIKIGDGARVGARSGVMHDIPAGETWVGYPAQPVATTMRTVAAMRQLADLIGPMRRLLRDGRRDGGAPMIPKR